MQVLCTANVVLPAGDSQLNGLLKTRDAVNGSPSCQQNSVTAVVRGVPPEKKLLEDLLVSRRGWRFTLPAPSGDNYSQYCALRRARRPGNALM